MTYNPFARIVVGLDESPPAAAALEAALTYAQQFEGEVICVNASSLAATAVVRMTPGPASAPAEAQVAGLDPARRRLLETLQKRVAAQSVPVTFEFVTNGAAAAIADAAERWKASAIVVGTHARGMLARAFTGSVAETTVRSARVPVVVVHENTAARPLRRAFVGIDASDPSQTAGRFGIALAAADSVRLFYACAVDVASLLSPAADLPFDPTPLFTEMRAEARDALDAALQYANLADVYPDTEIIEVNDLPLGLVRAASRRNADALVVGTHRRRPVERFFLGSTAAGVLRANQIPTIVVPADAVLPSVAVVAGARTTG